MACFCMCIGAVPVVTLNLQKAVPSGHHVPDAWHHQMVFGVGPQGIGNLLSPSKISKGDIMDKGQHPIELDPQMILTNC